MSYSSTSAHGPPAIEISLRRVMVAGSTASQIIRNRTGAPPITAPSLVMINRSPDLVGRRVEPALAGSRHFGNIACRAHATRPGDVAVEALEGLHFWTWHNGHGPTPSFDVCALGVRHRCLPVRRKQAPRNIRGAQRVSASFPAVPAPGCRSW